MPRVSEVPDDGARPEQRELFEADRAIFGEVLAPSRVYAHQAEAFRQIQALHRALLQVGTIPARLVLLARLRVAQLHDSPF